MPIDLPPVTRALLISNVGIFLLQQLFPDALLIHFALWPLGSELLPDGTTLGFQIWQLVTYGFLHGGCSAGQSSACLVRARLRSTTSPA